MERNREQKKKEEKKKKLETPLTSSVFEKSSWLSFGDAITALRLILEVTVIHISELCDGDDDGMGV